ncbi:TonB-dependent receptor [Alloacidobacterium dinghuense]|uniref:TonB-dependent receptor n=1 Tax=Alloacidobacterium dinghuense TaxID=2763107 RepID=A0A7G8BJI6_9BACT|nr:TonB-dependent receptor [Alloacidobacterium dinghuense]QNI32706.1 TonB-dependent receptor [Alloacidobacterium dinghuense]
MLRSRFILASVVILALTLAPRSWAQENATITGTVLDPSGAVVPNAAISLTNPATGQVRQTVSNNDGIYLFANVGVGNFTLSASAGGFVNYTRTGISVNTGQTLKEDVKLTIGAAGQTITVQADALQIQTETNELSNLISGQQVTQLATNGRNVTALAALGMGKSNNLPLFSGVNALTSANGISFNGTRVTHNIYMLDGGELNDRGCGGCFSSLPSMDALAEFQTLDSNYGPDYGIGSGGTILMVLKQGTHDFHGAVWYFNRNEDYDANNYFINFAGKPRPEFRLNEPGFNIGGPVWIPHVYNEGKTKTFFFVNEEWRRLIQGSSPNVVNDIAAANFPTAGQSLAYQVPANGKIPIVPVTTDPAKQALYTQDGLTPGQPFPNNTIPANLMDPNALLELNAGTFPKPNLGTNQYISSIPQPTDVREDVVRIDHNFSSKFQFSGHYLHDAVTQTYYPPLWGDSTYPTVGTAMLNPSWSSSLKLTQTYTPSLLNETSFLFSGNTINLDPVGISAQPSGWSASSFFPLANNVGSRMPEIDLQAPYSVNWSSSYYPWKNSYFGYEPRDDVSWTHGKHQFKFGFSWLHAVKNQQLQANTQGTAVFNNSSFAQDSYVNFLLGDAASFTQLQFLAGKHWVNNNYGFYANDNWKIIPRLTLNIGLRFDGLPHAFERFDQFANFVPADYDTTQGYPLNPDGTLNPASLTSFNNQPFYLNGIREAGVNGFPRGNVQNRYDTWQPRVGFAYDVTGDGKTVLRGGFGMFFERVQGNDVYNAALNPPFAYQPSANNVYFSNPNSSALTGSTTSQTFPSTLTNLKYQYSPPGTAMYSLGVQRQVAPSIVAVLQYVGSLGWDQNDDRQINTLPLTDPAVGYAKRQAVATNTANVALGIQPNANLYRIFPGFSGVQQEENETNFNYNSLQAGLRIENRHGWTVQFSYTWSHELDEVSNDLNQLTNPFNAHYDYGSGAFDRRNIFNASYIYNLPWFLHSSNTAERTILGGWVFSGITFAQSGLPQPINYTGPDSLGLGGNGATNRENQVTGVSYPKKQTAWFSTSSFANPVAPWNGGTNQGFGNSGKDAVILPGLFNFNMSLFKNIPLTSNEAGPKLELRFESYNTFNHTQFQGIDANSSDGNFGQVTSSYDARRLQLGAKFFF